MDPIVLSILSVLIISLMSFIGVLTLVLQKDLLESMLIYLVAFATGALLGASFFHLIPEVIELQGGYESVIPVAILLGMLTVYVLEKIIRWHHHHSVKHELVNEASANETVKPYVYNNLIGDGLHNFIDGLSLAIAFNVSASIGMVAFAAILIHELAQEFGDFGILVKGGLSPKKALFFNFLSAFTAVLGVIVGIMMLNMRELVNLTNTITTVVLSITTGMFLYLSLSDLVPELHEEKNLKISMLTTLVGIFGVVIMYMLTFIEVA